MRPLLCSIALGAIVGLASRTASAQVVGGYVVPPPPVVMSAPVAPLGPVVATPVVPYNTGYRVVRPRPWYGKARYRYRGWGYGPRARGPAYGYRGRSRWW